MREMLEHRALIRCNNHLEDDFHVNRKYALGNANFKSKYEDTEVVEKIKSIALNDPNSKVRSEAIDRLVKVNALIKYPELEFKNDTFIDASVTKIISKFNEEMLDYISNIIGYFFVQSFLYQMSFINKYCLES